MYSSNDKPVVGSVGKHDGDRTTLDALFILELVILPAIIADFLAAFPPLAPEICLCGAGVPVLQLFLCRLCFRYRVVDLTPSSRAEFSSTQTKPFLESSEGGTWSTFLNAFSLLAMPSDGSRMALLPRSWKGCA